jgi:hypothetical protein
MVHALHKSKKDEVSDKLIFAWIGERGRNMIVVGCGVYPEAVASLAWKVLGARAEWFIRYTKARRTRFLIDSNGLSSQSCILGV